MRLLRSDIRIGDYVFDFVTDFEVVSSWAEMTDTATITIPRRIRIIKDGKVAGYLVQGTDSVFKRGDRVTIDAGYYPTPEYVDVSVYNRVYEGYVQEINPKRPMVFTCEDEMYLLKRMRISNYESTGSIKLQTALEALRDHVNDGDSPVEFTLDIFAEDMDLGPVEVKNCTYVDFLETLKRQYGLKSYIREGTLYVGFARLSQNRSFNEPVPRRIITVRFGRDIIDYSNLFYRNAEDIDISLTCISIDENNQRIESKAGVDYGSQRNLYYYGLTQAALDKIAKEEVDSFKFDGYRGTMTVFGVPQIQHGDAVTIINDDIQDYEGTYLVQKVVTRFGTGGFRQEITLDQRIT